MLRDAGVRGKLFAVLAIPTLLLVVTSGWLVGGQMQSARQAGQVKAVTDVAIQLNRVVHSLQSERSVSLTFLQDSSEAHRRAVLAQRQDTDAAVRVLSQKVAASPIAAMSESIRAATARTTEAHGELVGARKSIDAGRFFATETDVFYSKIIAADLQLPGVISASASPDLAQRLQAEEALSTAIEYASHERDLVQLGYLDGTVNEAEFGQASALVAQQRQSLQDFQRSAPSGLFSKLDAKLAASDVSQMDRSRRHLTDLLKGRAPDAEGSAAWLNAANPRIASMVGAEGLLVIDIAEVAASLQNAEQVKAGVFGAGAFFGLLLAVLLAFALAQRITLPLRRLTLAAAEIGEELPHMVERMQTPGEGPGVVVDPIPVESGDEIGRLAAAFNTVNEVTLRVAKEQAALRASIAEMFVNVARRNQVLLGRQLSQLDKMEAREEDPDRLKNLFRLDHLATRMRRNAESLLVLAGIDSTRRLRQTMPLSDVIRTAVGEIEAYARIDSSVTDDPDVSGRHALSVAHLLAELLENATVFSNPDTRVVVAAAMTGHGVDVTITDYGLGMSDEEIVQANENIAHPPVAEIAVSQRLGLFVVGRIAARLGATTSLRKGRTSGTVVTVGLPLDVFEGLQVDEPVTPAHPLEATSSTETREGEALFDAPVRDEAVADVPALVASVTHALAVAAGSAHGEGPRADVALFNPAEVALARLPQVDVAALAADADVRAVGFASPASSEPSRRRLLPRRSRSDEPVDEAPVEDVPVEDVPVDEAPLDVVPVDEVPVAEVLVDELATDHSALPVDVDDATALADTAAPEIAASARRSSFFQRRGHTPPVTVEETSVDAESPVADVLADDAVSDDVVSDDVVDDVVADVEAPIARPASRRKRRSTLRHPAEEPVSVEPAPAATGDLADEHAVAEELPAAAAPEQPTSRRGLFGRRQWTSDEPAAAEPVVAPESESVVAEVVPAPLTEEFVPEFAWPVAEQAAEALAEDAIAIDGEPVEIVASEEPVRRRGLFGRRQRVVEPPAVEESLAETSDAEVAFAPGAVEPAPLATPVPQPVPVTAFYFVPAIDILPGKAMGTRGRHATPAPAYEMPAAPPVPVTTQAAPAPAAPTAPAPVAEPARPQAPVMVPAPTAPSLPQRDGTPVGPVAPPLPQRDLTPVAPTAPPRPAAPAPSVPVALPAAVEQGPVVPATVEQVPVEQVAVPQVPAQQVAVEQVPVEQVPVEVFPVEHAPAEVEPPMASSMLSDLDQHALNAELQKSALSELRGLYEPSFNQVAAPVAEASPGLIRRQRRAVEVVTEVEAVAQVPARSRNAGEVRGMLAGFRAGIERGRSASDDAAQADVEQDDSATNGQTPVAAEATDNSTD